MIQKLKQQCYLQSRKHICTETTIGGRENRGWGRHIPMYQWITSPKTWLWCGSMKTSLALVEYIRKLERKTYWPSVSLHKTWIQSFYGRGSGITGQLDADASPPHLRLLPPDLVAIIKPWPNSSRGNFCKVTTSVLWVYHVPRILSSALFVVMSGSELHRICTQSTNCESIHKKCSGFV